MSGAHVESSELLYASHSLLMTTSLQLQVEAPTKIQVLSRSLGCERWLSNSGMFLNIIFQIIVCTELIKYGWKSSSAYRAPPCRFARCPTLPQLLLHTSDYFTERHATAPPHARAPDHAAQQRGSGEPSGHTHRKQLAGIGWATSGNVLGQIQI